MKIANKKAPKIQDAVLTRVLQSVYDDINEIVNAVNNYEGSFDEWKGKIGDIRITEKGLQYRDKVGWQTVPIKASQMPIDIIDGIELTTAEDTVQKALQKIDDAL